MTNYDLMMMAVGLQTDDAGNLYVIRQAQYEMMWQTL